MALSYCSNWGHLNPEMNIFSTQAQPELPIELLGFYDSLAISDPCIDPFFEHDDQFFYSDETHLLPYLSSPMDHFNSLTPELVPLQEFEPYPYPKRHKSYEDSFYSDFSSGFYNGFVPNPCLLSPPELVVPLPDFQSPPPLGSIVESVRKPNGGSSSAQSIAARQRRRKITEKTQELGKLIPGGHKMNTAEMFQAAFNYIKYMQAQVGILDSMGSFQIKNEEPFDTQELQHLVASPLIQEKLYSEEKCLIPKQFVETLAHDHGIQSNPTISKDINQLIQTDDGGKF